MDLSKLKPADWLVGGGAIVFLISLFLPWYGFDAFGESVNNSGSDYFLTGWIPMLLILAVFAITVLPRLADGVKVPETLGPLPKLQAALIGAGVAAVLVLLRLVVASDNIGDIDTDFELDRKFGLFVALLAAIAVAVGAFMKYSGKDDGPSAPSGPATPF